MKNLYLLVAKQPCRLHYYSHLDHLGLSNEHLHWGQGRNIYITINQEIKDGDYGLIENEVGKIILTEDGYEFLIGTGVSYEYGDFHSLQKVCKKIVLTTDTDLIKDGVGEISDKFLNWFIKHPTCELVGVMSYCKHGDEYPSKGAFDKQHLCDVSYKINVATLPKSKLETFIKCYDRYNQLLKEGDYVDVQKDGVHQIYKKEDGQLYFKPYGLEDKVSAYFSNDIAKCDVDGNWINNDRYEDIEEEPKTSIKKEYVDDQDAYGYDVLIKEETVEEGFYRIRKSIDYEEFDFTSFEFGVNWQRGINHTKDDFAIKFANWFRKEDTPENAEKWFHYSDEDMLNAFKKEQLKK